MRPVDHRPTPSAAPALVRRVWLALSRQLARFLWACGLALCSFVWALGVAAREPTQVLLWRPQATDGFMDEIVVRTLGELNALGFHAQTTTTEPEPWPQHDGDVAVLRLRRQQGAIVVDAWCPDCALPLSQTMPARAADSNPEVVAVRAVDVLRATMLEFSERTRTQPPAEWSLPEPPAATAPEPAAPAAPVSASVPPWQLELTLGAGWLRELGRPGSELAIAGSLGVQWVNFGAGLRVSLPAANQAIEAAPGSVEPQRWRAAGYLQGLVELGGGFGAGLQIGAGTTWYRFRPTPVAGFSARERTHLSPLLTSQLSLRHWFLPNLGVHVTLGVALATDAPVVTMAGREVTRLDGPALETGAGLLLRLP